MNKKKIEKKGEALASIRGPCEHSEQAGEVLMSLVFDKERSELSVACRIVA